MTPQPRPLRRRAWQALTAVLTALTLVLGTGSVAAAAGAAQQPTKPNNKVDFQELHQEIDGFGFSQAFQRANLMRGMDGLLPEHQEEILELLFNTEDGAGFTILRLGIGSSPDDPYDLMLSIQPEDPGGPDAPPQYVWDGDDGGQVWLAQRAQEYGVDRFYANAWSAPGYMKTNGTDYEGGRLCGLPDSDCPSGDWRQAYADYLVQYARFYAEEGIEITDLAFTNEPDLATSYASMEFTPEQIVDMVNVLGPTIEESELDMNLVCCDAAGWSEQAEYSAAIEADAEASEWTDIHAGHVYRNRATFPLPTERTVWMSEWTPDGDTWNEAWDDGSGYDGMTVAADIHRTLTVAEANAYIYWFAASLGATRGMMQLDGEDYHVSGRYWALAAFSRFVRPEAYRVEVVATNPDLQVSAFVNTDGTRVIQVLNTATSAVRTGFTLDVGSVGLTPTAYLTDEDHSLDVTDAASMRGRHLSVELEPRALTTIVLE